MPRYTRAELEDEETNWQMTFPQDITQHGGFVNLNSLSGNLLISPSSENVTGTSGGSTELSATTAARPGQSQRPSSLLSPPSVTFFSKSATLAFGGQGSGQLSSSKRRQYLSCSRFSPLELVLLLITCMLLCIVAGLLYALNAEVHKHPVDWSVRVPPINGSQDYCLTSACVTVASAILNAMDSRADPCDDFYEFSCGGWIKANPLPDGKSIWGSFNKLWQENQLVMKNVLEREDDEIADNSTNARTKSNSSAELKAKVYYRSCLDKNETIEKRGAEPMLAFLDKIGGWNVSSKFNERSWDYQKVLTQLHNWYNRGGGLFTWAVGVDERNSTRNVIQLDQGGLSLPTRDYYLNKTANEEVLEAYLEYMTKVGTLLDGGSDVNATRSQMEKVVEFETRLANITSPPEDRRDDERLYHRLDILSLQRLAPALDWLTYFRSAFDRINYTFTEHEQVVLYSFDYLGNVSELITEYNSTKEGRETLSNYFGWTVVQSLTSTLSKPFREASKVLRKALIGSEGSESQWRYCVSDTNSVAGFALGAMFVRAAFHGESKPHAEMMISEIKAAFKDNLPNLEWMDEETRELALRKADAITDMIGFPAFILDPIQLDSKYEGLELDESEYFENNIKINMFSLDKNVAKIRKPANRSDWEMTPPAVNAYYAPTKNQIVFPAGILQAPFYDANYPKSLNFGAMGVVMGHELTHAFDDQGREYDDKGNLRQWWGNKTIEEFESRIKCFADQYSKYNVNEDHLNGKQTLGENIADNGGLKAAFHAYEDWMLTHQRELPLPGVNMTNQQLFFIGFAQVWCSVATPEASRLQIRNDPHSPGPFRVIGTLSNSQDFSREFRCPAGSRMNPETKCDVW